MKYEITVEFAFQPLDAPYFGSEGSTKLENKLTAKITLSILSKELDNYGRQNCKAKVVAEVVAKIENIEEDLKSKLYNYNDRPYIESAMEKMYQETLGKKLFPEVEAWVPGAR